MSMRDVIPERQSRDPAPRREGEGNPFLTFQRQMNRMFDDVFEGFGLAPRSMAGMFEGSGGWPNIEVSETDKEIKVTADLPGLDQNNVQIELADNVLSIKGEKKTESESKDRLFSERYYGRFERRIPVENIDEDKVAATFRNGVLTVTLAKSAKPQEKVKRIAINGQ
jgi:HSP20 family protein